MSSYVFWIFDSHKPQFSTSIKVLDVVHASYRNYQDTMRRYMLELTGSSSNSQERHFKKEIYDESLCPKILQCDKIKMGSYLLVAVRDKTAYKTPIQSLTIDVMNYLTAHSFQSTKRHLSIGDRMSEDLLDNFHFFSFVIDWQGNIVHKETEWCHSIESYVPKNLISDTNYIFDGYHTLGYKYKVLQQYRRFYETSNDNVFIMKDVKPGDITYKRLGFLKPILCWLKKNSPLWFMLSLDVIKLVYSHMRSEDNCFVLYHDPVIPSVKINIPKENLSYITSWDSFIQDGKVSVALNCNLAHSASRYLFTFLFEHKPTMHRYNVIHIAIKSVNTNNTDTNVNYYDIRPNTDTTKEQSCQIQISEIVINSDREKIEWEVIVYYGA